MSEPIYMLDLTAEQRSTILAGLGALPVVGNLLGGKLKPEALAKLDELIELVRHAEEFDEEDEEDVNLDLVELNERERRILTAALGYFAIGVITGQVKDDTGLRVDPIRDIGAIGGKLLGGPEAVAAAAARLGLTR